MVFSSDNGPENITFRDGTFGSAGGLRGRKRSLYEGGVRVPGIIRWPGTTPAGAVTDALVSTVDLLPTFVALAGGTLPAGAQPDGLDITPVLRGEAFGRDTPLMWEWRFPAPPDRYSDDNPERDDFWPSYGMREGDWMLLDNPDLGRTELYRLSDDPSQEHDRAIQHPDVVERFKAHAEAWATGLSTPTG